MSQTNELNTIEVKYNVDDVSFNSLPAWPFLRNIIFSHIYKKKYGYSSKLRVRDKGQLIKNFFTGFYKIFTLKKYDFFFFNNADKRTQIGDTYFDVFFDGIADKLGQDKSCFIEWAIDKHYTSKESYSTNVISDLPFKFLALIFSFFGSINVKNEEELEKIKSDYELIFNHRKDLKRLYGEYRMYNYLFRITKPKAIFIICNYSKIPIITAAKNNNVVVYEAQHGFIGNNHQFYNYHGSLPKETYPDYMLTFGDDEKNDIPNNFIFDKKELIPVGSFYLDEVYKKYTDIELSNYKEKFKLVFCVTLQGIHEEELLDWVVAQAKNNKTFLFIIRPKYHHTNYDNIINDNIILLPEYNIYQVLKYCDYNITIFSTTAIEAPYFNVETIFFNIDGLSAKYFDLKKLNAIVIDGNDSLDIESLEVLKGQNHYFVRDYLDNIKKLKIEV